MRETEAAAQALQDYIALGKDRTLEALARRYQEEKSPPTKSLKTLQNWSGWHHWQDRVAAHVAAQNALVLKRMQSDIAGERVRALRPLLKARASIEAQLEAGLPMDPRELTKLNAQIMQLLGEPLTDKHEVGLREADGSRLADFFASLSESARAEAAEKLGDGKAEEATDGAD